MMERRTFLATALAAAGATSLPLPAVAAPAAARWYAVYDPVRDSFFPICASTPGEARWYYNLENDWLDEAREDNPDASLEQLEVREPQGEAWLAEDEPSNADWAEAGYMTFCDGCSWFEPRPTRAHDGMALCEDCYAERKTEGSE